MNLPGYEYITHMIINRPWGTECRFTVKCADGIIIDDVIPVPPLSNMTDIENIVIERLKVLTEVPPEPVPVG